jgi:8-amino-7-oxononanoate synthase
MQQLHTLLTPIRDRVPALESQIVALLVPGNREARTLAKVAMERYGLAIRAILAPTVRAGTERLRISVHAHNSAEELIRLGHFIAEELR